MTTDPNSSRSEDTPTPTPPPSPAPGATAVRAAPRFTRASAIWLATGAGLVLLTLLIIFMLQNSTRAAVHFLGLSGTIPLGLALLIASVAGGVVVAIAGVGRVTQLRINARRTRPDHEAPARPGGGQGAGDDGI